MLFRSAQADQRLSEALKGRGDTGRRAQPAWFIAARDKEEAAGDALEGIYQQVALTPAHTKAGLAIKLQLVVLLYGGNAEQDGNEDDLDMVSQLLQSLIVDVTDQ